MQLSRKQSHCEVPEVRILHIPRWGSSTTPEGKRLPLVLACLEMKAADASVNGDSVDGHASWVWPSTYGIGATGSMAVSKTVDVGSSPTCRATSLTGCLRRRRNRLVAAPVSADPPSLREQSPESPWRLLLCFGGGIGIRGCLKSNCPKGREGSIPSQSTNRNWFFLSLDMGFKTQILKPMSLPK